MRKGKLDRKTKETDISIELNLDGTGLAEISTGVGFFDHMLTQIAVHGLFDLKVDVDGDLEVDAHHTIEDTAIVLGQLFDKALGDKKGIRRTASSYVPMDEALVLTALDFSGRPYFVFTGEWDNPMVGNIPTSLIEHFFQSFSVASRATIHMRIVYGRDNHHMAEALFKSFARALDAATKPDPRRAGMIPSSKGSL